MNEQQLCPCGTKRWFSDCCEPLLLGQQQAESPEQLMRSRYCGYVFNNMPYIAKTMTGSSLINFDEEASSEFNANTQWVRLEILDAPIVHGSQGYVEFMAYFKQQEKVEAIHERSRFIKNKNGWHYIDGTFPSAPKTEPTHKCDAHCSHSAPKLGRNSLCFCGSQLKYKRCCGQGTR